MRPIRALLVFILVVFLGGALLAPPLYWAAQSLGRDLPWLAGSPFHRFVNRSLLILALLGIGPLFHSLGARSWREVGLVEPWGQGRRFAGGFALGFCSLAAVAIIVLAAHGRRINAGLTPLQLGGKVAGAAASGLVVGIIEELLFRGAVFGALRKVWDWRFALIVSSLIYALVHFMESTDVTGPVSWFSGLTLLPLMLRGFGDWDALIPGFLNLTLAGLLLGLAYQRTGNLYCSIGLHAGWIFWLKSCGFLTVPIKNAGTGFWGTQKMIDGWPTLLILALALVMMGGSFAGKRKEAAP